MHLQVKKAKLINDNKEDIWKTGNGAALTMFLISF